MGSWPPLDRLQHTHADDCVAPAGAAQSCRWSGGPLAAVRHAKADLHRSCSILGFTNEQVADRLVVRRMYAFGPTRGARRCRNCSARGIELKLLSKNDAISPRFRATSRAVLRHFNYYSSISTEPTPQQPGRTVCDYAQIVVHVIWGPETSQPPYFAVGCDPHLDWFGFRGKHAPENPIFQN